MADRLGSPFLFVFFTDSVVPGVAAPQDILKVSFKVNLESKVIPRNFT